MPWNSLLYLSIIGPVATISIIAIVAGLGVRYRRELPKLPIKESIEALKLLREEEEAKLGGIQDELSTAREEIREGERARQFLEEARPEISTLQSQLIELQEAKRTAEAGLTGAQSRLESLEKVVAETAELKVKLAEEYAQARVDLTATKAQLEHLAAQVKDYEARRQEFLKLESQLPRLKEEHSRLERMVSELTGSRDELQVSLDELRKEKATLEGAIEGLKKQEELLLKAIEILKGAGGVSDDHDPRQDLWVPIFDKKKSSGGLKKEQDRIEHMHQQLEAASVRFPRRTLYAFHTALKIQDISPLTVLAGISGTGKSLLPRLYAKCMGMHFLNLPVQPGWNSPQDLFGFYNYIEHKFKATPLARAMVQFDQYNRGDWPLENKYSGFEDQVLLVLLDEMNLARVEYYFSELLSRLETRRSIDPSIRAERKIVEVPLEIGHAIREKQGAQKDYSISLYPGENILFAGTMNEDESTMSLSDKVLDRATVLRFGKPAEVMNAQPDMQKIDESLPLSLGFWKSWLEEKPVQREIHEAVQKLGEVMSKAQSPFGHRVAQGMLRYVALYPSNSLDGQRQALVDQIEQKVLPKLRGRDLSSVQEPLSQLTSLVSGMGDEVLAQAIEAGRSETEGTFMWVGLDRGDSSK